MKRHGPWRVLEIDPTEDRSAIRRAYAEKLKGLDPDSDIAGFTALRNARDHALTLARSLQAAEAGDEAAPEPASFDEQAFAQAEVAVHEHAPAEPAPAEPAEPTPPGVLLGILFPQGEYSDQPLTGEEREWATRALALVLDEAEQSSIDQQLGIEGWLAHHLASAWPRSAFLLEPAAAAFGWLDESGQLSERPAIQFLNQRLKGMRFVHKVEQPAHPLHKAWTELSKPGSRGPLARFRASRDDVIQLLNGIRDRYPEVERHLDPQRVASWENHVVDTPGTPWTVVGPIVVALVILFRVFSLGSGTGPAPAPPPSSWYEREDRWTAEETDGLVIDLFGERVFDGWLQSDAPDFWRDFNHMRTSLGGFGEDPAAAKGPLLQQLRLMTQLAARDAPFEQLVAIKQTKLELLRLLRRQRGAAECAAFQRSFRFPLSVITDPKLREDERTLAKTLLSKRLLLPSQSEFPTQAEIPGPVVERILSATGMSESAFKEAAQGGGSDSTQCQYRIALLETVLRQPGKVSEDLLRMI